MVDLVVMIAYFFVLGLCKLYKPVILRGKDIKGVKYVP
jgi:hypothetical protein